MGIKWRNESCQQGEFFPVGSLTPNPKHLKPSEVEGVCVCEREREREKESS